MRAAAAATVFILGAAVILVFANSLNSWVLGGLIGGLAALLISIPISVMLFTIISRRHDLKLQALHQELGEMGYVDLDEHGYEEFYETEVYELDEEYYNQTVNRRMADVRALPAAGQSNASAHREMNERTGRSIQSNRLPSQALLQGRGKGTPTRELTSERRQARHTRHEVNAMRSRFQTAALHAARREAQQLDNVEVIPTYTRAPNKSVPQSRTPRPLGRQPGTYRQARPDTELQRQQAAAQSNGSQRTLETSSGQKNRTRRSLSSEELHSTKRQPQTDSLYMDELQSEKFRTSSSYPQTENLRGHPQTGQMIRNQELGQSNRNSDMMTGNLKTPLVRRAPYLYEDDPLRQELAQQIDEEPIVRRSSRHVYLEDAD